MKEELIVSLSADIKDLKANLDKANVKLDNFSGKAKKPLNNTEKDISAIGSVAASVAGVIAGAFAINNIVSFGKSVIDTTAQFQRFEAVLSNTLGSGSAAQAAMQSISDFAASTPFQVDELTGAFVKLANQGFTPTTKEMTKLGDLASSTGKSFDQLVEAILDAQVGEYERLKEFGVRANDMGDKVQFTFKGVKTTVDKTAESIRNYLLSLGDLEGVSGSMAKISNTLGGKLSNLSDGFTQLQKNIGDLNSGALVGMVDLLQKAVGYFNTLTKTKLTEQKLGIGVTIDREESDKIIADFNKELARVGDIKDVSKLEEHMKYINTNMQFFQQAMLKETDTHARDVQFAYFNLYNNVRKAANGQMTLLNNEIEKQNQKLAENAKKTAGKVAFANKLDFTKTINKVDPNADVDLSSIQEASVAVNDFQAQTNLLSTGLNGIAIIGQESFTTIKDNIVVASDTATEKLTELQEVGLMVANNFAIGLGNAFGNAIVGGENFGEAMSKVFEQLGRDIIAQLIKMATMKLLLDALGIASGPAGIIASGVAQGAINASNGGAFGGRIATTNNGFGNTNSVSFEIRGDKLYGVLQNYQGRLDRIS